MSNVTLPPTGTGTATPVIEAATGPASAARQVVTIGDLGGNAVDSVGSLTETAPASDTASSGLNGRLQRVAQRLTSLIGVLPSALTPAGGLLVGSKTTNPSSVLTRPANTTAYTQGNLIASSTTAGSVTVPSFTAAGASAGSGSLRAARILTNKTSGWGAVPLFVEFWQAAPTVTNGDGGAYAIATGAANWLGSMTFAGLVQVADGAYCAAVPDVGGSVDFALASGTVIYWTLQYIGTASLTPASGQTITLIPEIVQD